MKRKSSLIVVFLSCLFYAALSFYLNMNWEVYSAAALVLLGLICEGEQVTTGEYISKLELTANSLVVIKTDKALTDEQLKKMSRIHEESLPSGAKLLILDDNFSIISGADDRFMKTNNMAWVKQ
ncbi:MAG: hypothetical protein JKX87_06240 [Cycloclasticus sp.]|nr:hypothetical protein [Cycloclasticus sp.]